MELGKADEIKVSSFRVGVNANIDDEINDWLEENSDLIVIDIKIYPREYNATIIIVYRDDDDPLINGPEISI